MSAVPVPQPSPSNSRDLIQKFREEYGLCIADARISEEHTATEGWQRLYSDNRRADRDKRRTMAVRLRSLADTLEDFAFSEDDEKAVKEIAKGSSDLRAAKEVFERETLDRVTASVKACDRVTQDFKFRADREESDAPLHSVGLAELMRMEISKQPRASFDVETGRVTVGPATT